MAANQTPRYGSPLKKIPSRDKLPTIRLCNVCSGGERIDYFDEESKHQQAECGWCESGAMSGVQHAYWVSRGAPLGSVAVDLMPHPHPYPSGTHAPLKK